MSVDERTLYFYRFGVWPELVAEDAVLPDVLFDDEDETNEGEDEEE